MSKIVFENLPLEPASFKEIDGITEDQDLQWKIRESKIVCQLRQRFC